MPSPFPGMDPFLEHPHFFAGLHGAMHTYIREALQRGCRRPTSPRSMSGYGSRTSARYVEPDTTVIQGVNNIRSETGGVAVAARTQPLVFEVTDDERTEMEVEIRTRRDDEGERLVTVIEVLSLANKTPGEKGRDLYLEKQREVLGSPVHLVEIDLLRGGEHTTPMSLERLRLKAGPYDYHISVHRFDQPGRFFIYPWKLDDAFPEFAIPLLPGDGQVPLDLGAVFTRCYDSGPYRRRVRYDPARLVPPLPAERVAWVRQMLPA